jgi:hypothetical protein
MTKEAPPVNLDLADPDAAAEPTALGPPDSTAETAEDQSELRMPDFWSIEGSESGA